MTLNQTYDRIVDLTSKIKKTGIGERITEAAKTGEPTKIETVFEQFKKEEVNLWKDIQRFNGEYDGKIIFRSNKNKKNYNNIVFRYNDIDPVSMFLLILFSDFEDWNFFEHPNVLVRALEFTGNYEIANYLLIETIRGDVVETLWNIFFEE